jgi:hypothetical protein
VAYFAEIARLRFANLRFANSGHGSGPISTTARSD